MNDGISLSLSLLCKSYSIGTILRECMSICLCFFSLSLLSMSRDYVRRVLPRYGVSRSYDGR